MNNKNDILNLINRLYLETIYNYKITNEEDRELRNVYEFIYLVIIDICHNENIDVLDIEVIGKGNFSNILRIGSKVVKIGSRRSIERFPNNSYINAMLLRYKINISKKLSLFIEVNELVDTNIIVTEEDLYQLYKKMRNLGLIWTDVKGENVGRLIRDNRIYWKEDLIVNDEGLGLDKFIGNKVLKRGDLVILDNDLIFKEDSSNIIMNNRCRRLEERYKSEKGSK